MSLDLCKMSLQQTRDLLELTDATLRSLCCRRFTGEELYVEAIRRVLGGKGRRGPQSIFVAMNGEPGCLCRGRVFHLRSGEIIEGSEDILIDPSSVYAIPSLSDAVIVSNWSEASETIDTYQALFHPKVKEFVGAPITNFIACRISGEPRGAIFAFNYVREATEYDAGVLMSLAVVIGSLVTLSNEVRETESAFVYTIEALARACEAAEEATGEHIVRVNRYAGALAANLGLSPDFVETISYSAQMHDVGKIRVPNEILLKPGRLTADEERLMRLHPVFGEKILGDSPRLRVAREVAVAHHENWDGSGYPYGLKGGDIPLAGRIVKLADVYDALRSRRSYKPPLSHRDALEVFRRGDDRIEPKRHFDPDILKTFFEIEHMYESIYESVAVAPPREWSF
ncbi:HD-GYP domain-containing protein [Geobacter pickeringii]|uniref:HD family phosphohydrolase n=1 Tax=Geobacter pickeringii TaxID=345632 RepID=A0A0B5B9N4_9BACT|nr:HD domain-containing phosphohydrolase [Geobacter pickeringii]AJE03423.1 HD family phosphohydrolase [Geobacter pickeringii]